MTVHRIHSERLSDEELAFLLRKDEQETRSFYRTARIVMAICFIIPFVVAWGRAFFGENNPFEFGYYFLGVLFLLAFAGTGFWLAYTRILGKLKKDIKERAKTIELTRIKRKQYMPHNKTYYFYLDSPVKLSIEVEEQDYHAFNETDEVNIEYSTNARFYFGYF